MRLSPLIVLLAVSQVAVCVAKKQPLRFKQSSDGNRAVEKERPPPPNSMYGAMEEFHRQRTRQMSGLSEQQLEAKLREAHVPDDVMDDIRKARYLSRRGRVRLAPKEAMVDALSTIEDTAEDVRAKPLSALVAWARRAGAPTAAMTAALSAGTPVAQARATLAAVGAGSSLSRSSSTEAPSAEVLANDAEGLLLLHPPAVADAARLYTRAAELCRTGAELGLLNSKHATLAAEAKKNPEFPTVNGIDLARAEREQNMEASKSAKTVPVRACHALARLQSFSGLIELQD